MHFKEGIYPGMGMEEYHAWKLDKDVLIEGPISCSVLKAFDANPYAWLVSDEQKETPALRKGKLFDAAVTDPDELIMSFRISQFENFKTKEAREWRDSVTAQGQVVVSESEFNRAEKARNRVFNHPEAGQLVDGAQFQVGVVYNYGDIPAKCLIDILPSEDGEDCETLVDYKTISTGLDDKSIRDAIGKYKYHWQAAFYKTLANKVSEDRVFETFKFIFQDVNTLEVRVVELDDDSMALGSRAVGAALKNFLRCAHQGIKSRYLNKTEILGLMLYHAMGEDEDLTKREEIFA